MDACNSPAPDNTQTSAAVAIAGNTDLLTKILLHLPLKSIAEFKSVSTDWHSLLTSSYFTGRRTQNPNNTLPTALLLHPTSILNRAEPENLRFLPPPKLCFVPLNQINNPSPPPLTSLSFVNPNSHTYICNSCNGLLICCDPTRKNYFIVNPSTHKFIYLPQPSSTSSVLAMNLAYDPYSVSAHHYKVVCIGLTFSNKLGINIYSSESKFWKSCQVDPNLLKYIRKRINVKFNSGVFLDSAIHWVLEGNSSSSSTYYFDLNNDSINRIPLPLDHRYMLIRYFGKWKDRLYLIYGESSKLYVYEMKRDYSGWGFKFHINLDESIVKYFCIHFMYWEDDNEGAREKEKAILVMHVPNKSIRYKVKDDAMEKIIDIPSISLKVDPENAGYRRYGWFDCFPYFESLACV